MNKFVASIILFGLMIGSALAGPIGLAPIGAYATIDAVSMTETNTVYSLTLNKGTVTSVAIRPRGAYPIKFSMTPTLNDPCITIFPSSECRFGSPSAIIAKSTMLYFWSPQNAGATVEVLSTYY